MNHNHYLSSKQIPNILSLVNLTCGLLSVLVVFQHALPNNIRIGAILILTGALIDGLDGKIARYLNAESELGQQLDSLADLVTFGVAPSCLLIASGILHHGFVAYATVIIYVLCGAYRLARYNIANCSNCFQGCPITCAGASIALLIFLAHIQTLFTINHWALIIISLTLSLFMVSKVNIKRLI